MAEKENESQNPNEINFSDPEGKMKISLEINSPEFQKLDPEIKKMLRAMIAGFGYTITSVVETQQSLEQSGLRIHKALEIINAANMKAALALSAAASRGHLKSN